MAELLAIVYSVLVLVVAATGIVFVLWSTDDGARRDGTRWMRGLAAGVVVLFLVAMIGGLLT